MYGPTQNYGYQPYPPLTTNLTQSVAWNGPVYTIAIGYGYSTPTQSVDGGLRALARKIRERRREVAHVPPVELEFCTLPMPEKRVLSQPRGVAWLRAHGGPRERRALRASVEKKDGR